MVTSVSGFRRRGERSRDEFEPGLLEREVLVAEPLQPALSRPVQADPVEDAHRDQLQRTRAGRGRRVIRLGQILRVVQAEPEEAPPPVGMSAGEGEARQRGERVHPDLGIGPAQGRRERHEQARLVEEPHVEGRLRREREAPVAEG